MKKIVFATHNTNKVLEVQKMLRINMKVLSLADIGCTEDIPETQPTLEGNAKQKADFILDKFQLNCFADDSGLFVESLNGAPGVYSARYAGSQKNDEANISKLLNELNGKSSRTAYFKTVIALNYNGGTYTFSGKCDGIITIERMGNDGFGYDSIFKPLGYDKTFAQLSLVEKNKIGHRGKAIEKLMNFLNTQASY